MTAINATRRTLSTMAVISLLALTAMAEDQFDWPRFRGPDGNGISKETAWNPAALNTPKILWKTHLVRGYSVAAIKGDRLYLTGFRHVICLNSKDGKQVWDYEYPEKGEPHMGLDGTHATPTVDGGSVYALGNLGHLFCLNAADGKVKWQKNLQSDFGALVPNYGFAASPVVFGDLLLINAGEHGLCLKKATGDTVWASPAGTLGAHATPVFYKQGGKDCMAIFNSKAIQGIEVATGKKLWSYNWLTHSADLPLNMTDPIVFDGKVFISTGYGYMAGSGGCALIDISGPEAKLVWQNKNLSTDCSTAIMLDGYVYGLHGHLSREFELRCLEVASGKVMWATPMVWGGLMAADGKLIVTNNSGDIFVVKANPKAYEEIASAKGLPQEKGNCWTAPVLSRGVIYIRTVKAKFEGDVLIAIDVSK